MEHPLPDNGIFVFGSNLAGRHGKGAALYALNHYGAIYGQGTGFQGRSYAIPTKDRNLCPMPLEDISLAIAIFVGSAALCPSHEFWVTPIGCGLAGFSPHTIAPFFRSARNYTNIYLPKEFTDVLDAD